MSAPYVTLDQEWTSLFRAGKVRWMPGMVYSGGDRVLAVDDTHALWSSGENEPYWELLDAWVIPDWSDPATIGCLLHQAREAWAAPSANASRDAVGQWYVEWWDDIHGGGNRRIVAYGHPAEPAAILAAIAAAPPRSTK